MDILLLACLILLNGVFAMSEVALLTARRAKLLHLAQRGDRLAEAALKLTADPTRFLSTIQIGITSIGLLNGIVGEALFAPAIAAWLARHGVDPRWSAFLATGGVVVVVTYASIVVGELVPKRLGQHGAERIAKLVAWPMRVLAHAAAPFVSLLAASTNALLAPLLALFRIRGTDGGGSQALSAEEIRTIVLESSNFLAKKHVSILMNLFDLDDVTVRDVMVPRPRIEAIRLDDPVETVTRQLATSYHMRIPVLGDGTGDVRGILHLRKVIGQLQTGSLDRASIESLLTEPYYVPATTPVLAQLQYFQERKERLALVVDEYGELLGLVTVDDIVEEMVGKFTTSMPSAAAALGWANDGSASADGSTPVREVNRALGLTLPTDGPKTLNGLILEHLQDIPESDVSVRISGVRMEILHAQGRSVKSVRIFRPKEEKNHGSSVA